MKRVREKNFLWIILTLMLLIGTIMVALPLPAQSGSSPVRIYVDMPLGYIPGVSAGGMVFIDIMIESPSEWENTAEGIVGWSLYAKVDGSVLTPLFADGAKFGYFLYDFCVRNGYYTNFPQLLFSANATHWIDVAEYLIGWETLGKGAGDSGKMVTLVAISLSETAYSPIDIYEAYYYTIAGKFAVEIVEDGHYNPSTLQPPVASFTEDKTEALVGEVISFGASASYDPDGTIVSYDWDFGDATVGSGVTVTHAYAAVGIYTVTLTVTDNDGLKYTAWGLVTVEEAHDVAVINLTPSAINVSVGEMVSVDVVVENQGTASESFTVTAYYYNATHTIAIGTEPVTLANDTSTTVSFNWNSTGVSLGSYTIKANVTVVEGETDTADNELVNGVVTVQEAPAPGVPLYVIIAATAVTLIIVVGIAVYFIRVRKPKPT